MERHAIPETSTLDRSASPEDDAGGKSSESDSNTPLFSMQGQTNICRCLADSENEDDDAKNKIG